MIYRLRRSLLLLSGIVVLVAAAAPSASAAGGCGGSAYSALNQYCETVPTAQGGQAPAVGTPSVAQSLPPGVVARIQQQAGRGHSSHRAAMRALLRIPAAPSPPSPPLQSAVVPDGSGFPLWLALVMAGIGLALILAAAKRRRRRSHEPAD